MMMTMTTTTNYNNCSVLLLIVLCAASSMMPYTLAWTTAWTTTTNNLNNNKAPALFATTSSSSTTTTIATDGVEELYDHHSSSSSSSSSKPSSSSKSSNDSKFPKPPNDVPPPSKLSHYYFLKEEEQEQQQQQKQQQSTILEENLLEEHAALESYISSVKQHHVGNANANANDIAAPPKVVGQEQAYLGEAAADDDVPYFIRLDGSSDDDAFSFSSTSAAATADDDDVNVNVNANASKSDTIVSDANTKKSVNNNTMDRHIYQLNKLMIDTVYKVVCMLYPVSASSTTSSSTLIGSEYDDDDDVEAAKDLRFERFYVLETVARVPYFAYLSVMHLQETFGERGSSSSSEDKIKIDNDDNGVIIEVNNEDEDSNETKNAKRITKMRTHYAQADNELHHLLIMESLGGNTRLVDKSIAHVMAFVYYWYVVAVYTWNEQAAYHLSELIENHAYNTYNEFLALHETELKSRPVPDIARKYYEQDYKNDPYLFDTFCTVVNNSKNKNPEDLSEQEQGQQRTRRRPHRLNNLYDVFRNIRDDENEHWMALCNLVQYDDMNAVDSVDVQSTTTTATTTTSSTNSSS